MVGRRTWVGSRRRTWTRVGSTLTKFNPLEVESFFHFSHCSLAASHTLNLPCKLALQTGICLRQRVECFLVRAVLPKSGNPSSCSRTAFFQPSDPAGSCLLTTLGRSMVSFLPKIPSSCCCQPTSGCCCVFCCCCNDKDLCQIWLMDAINQFSGLEEFQHLAQPAQTHFD